MGALLFLLVVATLVAQTLWSLLARERAFTKRFSRKARPVEYWINVVVVTWVLVGVCWMSGRLFLR